MGTRRFGISLREFSSTSHKWDIELNTRREIPYLQATMYYFVYYINILLTRRNRLNSRFKKRTRCYSFMALNRASDVPAADWLSQTQVKNYSNFSCVVILLSSVVEIPIKHSSLYNKAIEFPSCLKGIKFMFSLVCRFSVLPTHFPSFSKNPLLHSHFAVPSKRSLHSRPL